MRALVIVLIIVAIVAAVTSSARQPILEIDNPWSGHHIAVTSVKPGMVDYLRREGLVIEFEITPPSGDRPTLIKDFVTVWQAMKPQVDASGFDAVMMTVPNAATEYAVTEFTKKSGEWFMFDRWEWIPPGYIRPMIRDFGPLEAYTLRSNEPSLAYWNASAMLLFWAKPGYIKSGNTQLAVSTFPYPLAGRSVWLTRDTCDSIEKRGLRLGRRLDPSDRYTAVTTLRVDWRMVGRVEGAGYTAAVLDRTGYVDWCGALSRSNRAVSHVLP